MFTHVKLTSLTMYMTYLNIKEDLEIKYDDDKTYEVKKGYYNIEQFSRIFEKVGCKLEVNKHNGKIKITGTESKNVEIPGQLLYLLGITSEKTETKILPPNESKENLRLPQLSPLSLYVYLDELDREYNLYNGKPSSLLCIIPLHSNPKFGDVVNIEPNSSFKRLAGLSINRFKFTIKDDNGHEITNPNIIIELKCLL